MQKVGSQIANVEEGGSSHINLDLLIADNIVQATKKVVNRMEALVSCYNHDFSLGKTWKFGHECFFQLVKVNNTIST